VGVDFLPSLGVSERVSRSWKTTIELLAISNQKVLMKKNSVLPDYGFDKP